MTSVSTSWGRLSDRSDEERGVVDYFDWEENDTHENSVFDLQLYGRQMALPTIAAHELSSVYQYI